MTKAFLYTFLHAHRHAVLSTVSLQHMPEAALVGFAVTQDLRIIFDTVSTSRKYQNLIHNPAIAFVIGWDNDKTVQYEGTATIPKPDELNELLPVYFNVFPDGLERRETWKDLVYFVVKPRWIRYSDFKIPLIKELDL